MESDTTRQVEISFTTAKEWYNKGGFLKSVALQAFTEEELKSPTYEDIAKEMFKNNRGVYITFRGTILNNYNRTPFEGQTIAPNNSLHKSNLEALLAKNKLINVANYLNDDWKPEPCTKVYYLAGCNPITVKPAMFNHIDFDAVVFKSASLAIQAKFILGDRTIRLALSPLGF